MSFKLLAPVIKTFPLEKTDALFENTGEPTTVTIQQARQKDHYERQELFSTLERRFDANTPDETTLIQTISMEALKRLECFLTMIDCNIADEEGKPLFKFAKNKNGGSYLTMSQNLFNEAFGRLPPEVANEIHEKVLEVNIMWSGRGEDLKKDSED